MSTLNKQPIPPLTDKEAQLYIKIINKATDKGMKMALQRVLSAVAGFALLISLTGCMTVGNTMPANINQIQKWDVTIIKIQPVTVYNTPIWIFGHHIGQKITYIFSTGEQQTIVQPKSNSFELKAAQKAVLIVNQGQMWVQPTDYPLPPEFNSAPVK
jgi:hypothetical protein